MCLPSSLHDQIGHPGEREHSGRRVASPWLHTHSEEEEVPERGIGTVSSCALTFAKLLECGTLQISFFLS